MRAGTVADVRVQVATVVCDGCGVETEGHARLRDAVAEARMLTWTLGRQRDLCAECRPGPEPPVPSGLAARLRTIGSGRCWCGQPGQHDWAGKAAGAPHPR